jgi:hypothetical protein
MFGLLESSVYAEVKHYDGNKFPFLFVKKQNHFFLFFFPVFIGFFCFLFFICVQCVCQQKYCRGWERMESQITLASKASFSSTLAHPHSSGLIF